MVKLSSALRDLQGIFQSDSRTLNLNGSTISDFDLLASILQSICGGISEALAPRQHQENYEYEKIWNDFNRHLKHIQYLDLRALLDVCLKFIQYLTDTLQWYVNDTSSTI